MGLARLPTLFRFWRGASTQARPRIRPSLGNLGRSPRPDAVKNSSKEEHDYSITPTSYTYLVEENQDTFGKYPLVTSRTLAIREQRPKNVRMLSREFITDSLYNPHYGYFSNQAQIMSFENPFDFKKMENMDEFLDKWAIRYKNIVLDGGNPTKPANLETPTAVALGKKIKSRSYLSKQLWHTPTELFHPYYGQAIARYLLEQMKERQLPRLVIYEVGAGNGTLMADILDYVRDVQPMVYTETSYNIIEVSSVLALKQRAHAAGHGDIVNVINKSIFDWELHTDSQCFFIALEVWDNFAHDVIRYDNTTLEPYQGYVVIDGQGDFREMFSKKLDANALRLLELRDKIPSYQPRRKLGSHPRYQSRFTRNCKSYWKRSNGKLTDPEYIPTDFANFLYILKEKFPNHMLLASDFTHFDTSIDGYCAPVVQTFMDNIPVTISTYMALQGYFDIMFPTDFELAGQLYHLVCGKRANLYSHRNFMARWSDHQQTETKTGENPLLSFYRNASFLCT